MMIKGLSLAIAEDLPAIADMWRASIDSIGIRYEHEESVADLLAKLTAHWPDVWEIWVVRRTIHLDAFIAIDRSEAVLAQLFVAPDSQGKGIGQALLKLAKDEMTTGISLWTDARNTCARRFYERAGFTLLGLEKHPVASHYRAQYRWFA
jgi:GNAT superfamily N-acetyltransferase